MGKQAGFTLIELMIVIAVIAVIAAIAIPNLIRSRMNANEAAAIGTLETIASAETAFAVAVQLDVDGDGRGEFGTLAQLGTPPAGGTQFLDLPLSITGQRSGYTYTLVIVNPETAFTCNADPTTANDGTRHFFIDESGVVTQSQAGPANAASTPVQ